MPIKPKDLLDLANSIFLENELAVRTVINRAYYAAYRMSVAFHESLPVEGSAQQSGTHKTLITQLIEPDSSLEKTLQSTSKTIGYILEDMKKQRVTADYHLSKPMNNEMAKDCLRSAFRLNEKITQILPKTS